MYSTMGGWQVDFANSVKLSFICQIIDVDTGLILFAEEISRESIEYAKSGSFENESAPENDHRCPQKQFY